MKLAKLLVGGGFNDMTTDDVNDQISAPSQPLTDKDLKELTKLASEEEEEEQEVEEEEVDLTLDRLSTLVRAVKEL